MKSIWVITRIVSITLLTLAVGCQSEEKPPRKFSVTNKVVEEKPLTELLCEYKETKVPVTFTHLVRIDESKKTARLEWDSFKKSHPVTIEADQFKIDSSTPIRGKEIYVRWVIDRRNGKMYVWKGSKGFPSSESTYAKGACKKHSENLF